MLSSINEIPVANKDDILKRGREVYLTCENKQKMIYLNHKFADETSIAIPAFILAEERFVSGHDDTVAFIEIIDTDDKTAGRWKFSDFPLTKKFSYPNLYDDDCLILYLKGTYHIPVKRGYGYGGYPTIMKCDYVHRANYGIRRKSRQNAPFYGI